MKKNTQPEVVIISDVHLGTFGCHAEELLRYLKNIQPKHLILNGDILDIWNFDKRYFPQTHLAVIDTILQMAINGVKVDYIVGNHDELLRRFTPFASANISFDDKLLLTHYGKKVWVFHGDIFDASIRISKSLAKLGGKGYDILIRINTWINRLLTLMGRPKMSLSRKIKDSIKQAVKYIDDFEQTAADLAIQNKYDVVVCGHIHQPQNRTITTKQGSVLYLNSGDWVENLTALECYEGNWKIFHYPTEQQHLAVIPAVNQALLPSYEMLKARILAV